MSNRPTEDEFHAQLRAEGVTVEVASLVETERHECGWPLFEPADRPPEEWWRDDCVRPGLFDVPEAPTRRE